MIRLVLRGVLAGVVLAFAASTAVASAAPPDSDEPVVPGRLVPIPPGCPVPPASDLAFVGVVVDKDGFIERGTVRFEIEQLRAGSAAAYTVDGIIDVRYGPDSKYLEVGERYLVSAAVDPEIGRLASKVAPGTPLFGGNDVIGLDDTAVECPDYEDPIVTLHVDGTSVDSGVLSPMFEDTRVLLATIGVPAAIAGIVLIVLVLLRSVWGWMMSGVIALGRAAVTPTSDHRAVRVRRHRPRRSTGPGTPSSIDF